MSEQWIIKVLSTIHQSVGRKVVFSICFSSRYCRSVSVTAVCVGRRRVAESLSSVHTNRYSALESERSRHSGHNLTHLAWQRQHTTRHTAVIPTLLSGTGGEAGARCGLCLPWQGVPGASASVQTNAAVQHSLPAASDRASAVTSPVQCCGYHCNTNLH